MIELAVAGNAQYIITRNVRDLATGQLAFPQLKIVTPEQYLKDNPS